MVHASIIHNCPLTVAEIKNYHTIFGTNVISIRGKTVRTKTEPVVSDYIVIPPIIVEQNSKIDLTGDFFFVDKIFFGDPGTTHQVRDH